MQIKDISVPEIYKTSADFRFFLKWFGTYLDKLKYDTENLPDIYDPLKCPDWLLWMLADTMGFKYDDRLPVAFNRLVLLYFMSMIRNKGSKDGVTLAAEVNLAQFNILEYGKEKDILYNRLEDTAIPVNSVRVTPHTPEGYIEVIYMSEKEPIDACIEYVRPLGMYLFQFSGVRFDTKSKVVIDARLCNTNDIGMSIGPTHVGHYSRKDYASMQKVLGDWRGVDHKREDVYYRNSDYELHPTPNRSTENWINPGFRTLYSLQLCNNEHITKSLLSEHDEKDRIFGIGYNPQEVDVRYPSNYILPDLEEMANDDNTIKYVIDDSGQKVDITYPNKPEGISYKYPTDRDGRLRVPNAWNLRYDKANEEKVTSDVYTIENKDSKILNPRPGVNPVMTKIGDAISVPTSDKVTDNAKYSKTNDESDD